MREIPKKNYIYVTLMAIGVVVICFALMNVYNSHNEKIYDSSVREIISEIKYDDLESYLQENRDVVLYINDRKIKNNSALEKDIKELIAKNNVQQYFVYIEKNDELIKEYDLNSNNPIFISYNDGEIAEIFSENNYDIEDIEEFFIRNGVIESD